MSTLRLSSRNVLRSSIYQLSARFASTNAPRSPIKTGLYASAFAVSAGLFAVYYFDSRSAIHRYLIAPVLRYTLDPETSHKFAVKVLRSGLGPRDTQADDEKLNCEVSLLYVYHVKL
jgi:dihydroorotate dehydrogenase